jgi:hypothetical protein
VESDFPSDVPSDAPSAVPTVTGSPTVTASPTVANFTGLLEDIAEAAAGNVGDNLFD